MPKKIYTAETGVSLHWLAINWAHRPYCSIALQYVIVRRVTIRIIMYHQINDGRGPLVCVYTRVYVCVCVYYRRTV